MLRDFIFSKDGLVYLTQYNNMFGVVFRIDIPDGEDLVFETKGMAYKIDENVSIEEFKKIIRQSIKEKKNFLQQRFENNIIKYENDVFY